MALGFRGLGFLNRDLYGFFKGGSRPRGLSKSVISRVIFHLRDF